MHIARRIGFDVGQQRRQVARGHGQRIVQRRVFDEFAQRSLALADFAHQLVERGHRSRQLAGELLLVEGRRHPAQAAHDTVDTPGIVAQHFGKAGQVVDRRLEVPALRSKQVVHVARQRIQVAERPVDVRLVVFQESAHVGQRARQVGRHLRNFLLHEIELRPRHVHQVAVAARANRVALLKIGRGRAEIDFDGLGTHQRVAHNLGFRIGRNAVGTLDGELQHHFVAARRVERDSRHGTDFHSFDKDGRRGLHPRHLVVDRIVFRIAAEDVESFQKPDSGPRRTDHRHGEQPDFHFSFHILFLFIFLLLFRPRHSSNKLCARLIPILLFCLPCSAR